MPSLKIATLIALLKSGPPTNDVKDQVRTLSATDVESLRQAAVTGRSSWQPESYWYVQLASANHISKVMGDPLASRLPYSSILRDIPAGIPSFATQKAHTTMIPLRYNDATHRPTISTQAPLLLDLRRHTTIAARSRRVWVLLGGALPWEDGADDGAVKPPRYNVSDTFVVFYATLPNDEEASDSSSEDDVRLPKLRVTLTWDAEAKELTADLKSLAYFGFHDNPAKIYHLSRFNEMEEWDFDEYPKDNCEICRSERYDDDVKHDPDTHGAWKDGPLYCHVEEMVESLG